MPDTPPSTSPAQKSSYSRRLNVAKSGTNVSRPSPAFTLADVGKILLLCASRASCAATQQVSACAAAAPRNCACVRRLNRLSKSGEQCPHGVCSVENPIVCSSSAALLAG
eukprot:6192050-Pleurochrysis_carterae.AAC.2